MPRTPLLQPDRYFEEHRARAWPAVLVALLVALLTALLFVFTLDLFVSRIEDPPSGLVAAFDRGVSVAAISLFAALLVGLLFEAAIVHAIVSWLDGGDGSFGDTVAVTFWSAVPDGVHSIGSFLVVWVTLSERTIPSEREALLEQTRAVFDTGGLVPTALLVVAAAWTIYVWGPGLHHRHDVPLVDGYAIAGVVVIGGLLLGLL